MKSKRLAILAAFVGLLVASGPLLAHHSTASYDMEHLVTFSATVTGFEFVNPHVLIHFEVKDESGNVQQWTALTAPPQRLYRAGWNTKILKPGDQIIVTGVLANGNLKIGPGFNAARADLITRIDGTRLFDRTQLPVR